MDKAKDNTYVPPKLDDRLYKLARAAIAAAANGVSFREYLRRIAVTEVDEFFPGDCLGLNVMTLEGGTTLASVTSLMLEDILELGGAPKAEIPQMLASLGRAIARVGDEALCRK